MPTNRYALFVTDRSKKRPRAISLAHRMAADNGNIESELPMDFKLELAQKVGRVSAHHRLVLPYNKF